MNWGMRKKIPNLFLTVLNLCHVTYFLSSLSQNGNKLDVTRMAYIECDGCRLFTPYYYRIPKDCFNIKYLTPIVYYHAELHLKKLQSNISEGH